MKSVARRKPPVHVPVQEHAPDYLALEQSPGVSPVHALHDRLVDHFGSQQPDNATAISSQARMALIFWTAVISWIILASTVYAIVASVPK